MHSSCLTDTKTVNLTKAQAEGFYYVHKDRPFFGELVEFMPRSPVVIMALRGEDAVAKNREIMGATNPAEAAEGTIRKDHLRKSRGGGGVL